MEWSLDSGWSKFQNLDNNGHKATVSPLLPFLFTYCQIETILFLIFSPSTKPSDSEKVDISLQTEFHTVQQNMGFIRPHHISQIHQFYFILAKIPSKPLQCQLSSVNFLPFCSDQTSSHLRLRYLRLTTESWVSTYMNIFSVNTFLFQYKSCLSKFLSAYSSQSPFSVWSNEKGLHVTFAMSSETLPTYNVCINLCYYNYPARTGLTHF